MNESVHIALRTRSHPRENTSQIPSAAPEIAIWSARSSRMQQSRCPCVRGGCGASSGRARSFAHSRSELRRFLSGRRAADACHVARGAPILNSGMVPARLRVWPDALAPRPARHRSIFAIREGHRRKYPRQPACPVAGRQKMVSRPGPGFLGTIRLRASDPTAIAAASPNTAPGETIHR